MTGHSTADSALPIWRFEDALAEFDQAPLIRGNVETLQVNLGKLCNQACLHCHVAAGPHRNEVMQRPVVERLVALLANSPNTQTVDLTGGAPELNPNFRWLVKQARALRREVIDRCNLTVLSEPGQEDTAEFLRDYNVQVVASLPCYGPENVEAQRGRGVFDRSIAALKRLNELGYGTDAAAPSLTLVYNPGGPFLPGDQLALEDTYRRVLRSHFGIEFDRLLTIANMPIARFAEHLERKGNFNAYMNNLIDHFNPATVPLLMCRSLVSIGWDGRIFDCDFNQGLGLTAKRGIRRPSPGSDPQVTTLDRGPIIWDVESLDDLAFSQITVDSHCYGCTAGSGSGCSGALK